MVLRKLISIAWMEYRQHVFQKRFLIFTLWMPLSYIFMLIIFIISILVGISYDPLGVVDPSGWIDPALTIPEQSVSTTHSLKTIYYKNEDLARQALVAGAIQAYVVMPPDYPQSRQITLVYKNGINPFVEGQIQDQLRNNWLRGQSQITRAQLLDGGAKFVSESAKPQPVDLSLLIPAIISYSMLLFTVTWSGGYFLQALRKEVENRMTEVLASSVSPSELVNGKIAGNLLAGITPMFTWGLLVGVIWLLLSLIFRPEPSIAISASTIIILLLYIPYLILTGAQMTSMGALMATFEEVGIFTILFDLPLFAPLTLINPLTAHPQSTLALIMSLFPLTAPGTLLIRAAFTQIPAWQLLLSTLLLWASAAGGLLLAPKVFRQSMLVQGKGQLFSKLLAKVRKKVC